MARLSRQDLEDILQKEVPGAQLLHWYGESDHVSTTAQAESEAFDLDELKRTFLGDDYVGDEQGPVAEGDVSRQDEMQDEIVLIAPAGPPDRWGRGPGPKRVIISGRERRIVARQG